MGVDSSVALGSAGDVGEDDDSGAVPGIVTAVVAAVVVSGSVVGVPEHAAATSAATNTSVIPHRPRLKLIATAFLPWVANDEPGHPLPGRRLDIGHPAMMHELAEVAAEPLSSHGGYRAAETFGYRLIARRMPDVYNSSGRDIPRLARVAYNPAFMNPDDIAHDGLAAGDVIEMDSGCATILGVVESAADVRRRAISMAHGFGDAPSVANDEAVRTIGSNTSRLTPVDRDFDPIHGLPTMSAIPVDVRPHIISPP